MEGNNAQFTSQSNGKHWSAATVVDRSSRWRERKIKESAYIRAKKTYDIDPVSSLSPVWNSLIRQLQRSETMFAI